MNTDDKIVQTTLSLEKTLLLNKELMKSFGDKINIKIHATHARTPLDIVSAVLFLHSPSTTDDKEVTLHITKLRPTNGDYIFSPDFKKLTD